MKAPGISMKMDNCCTITDDEKLHAHLSFMDSENFILAKIKDAGGPVSGILFYSLREGWVITSAYDVKNRLTRYTWRSKEELMKHEQPGSTGY